MRRLPVLTVACLAAALALAPVAQAVVGNAPNANDNNRVVGMDGGNIFYNGIVPGGSVSSNVALTGLVAGGSPSGVSGSAGLVATIASTDMNIVASGAGSASNSGLTATIGADGSYSLSTTAAFTGKWIVSLGDSTGNGAHLVVAQAAAANLAAANFTVIPAGTFAAADTTFANNAATVAADANEAALALGTGATVAVTAGSMVTVSLEYQTNSAAVNIAVIGFDGGPGGNNVSYSNPTGTNLATGKTKSLATSFVCTSGTVTPGFQVFNGGTSAASVTISSLKVIMAGPVTEYAVGASEVALPALNTWGGNPSGVAGIVGPVASGSGISLTGIGNTAANAFTAGVALAKGEYSAEAMINVSAANAGAAITLMVTDGVANTFASFQPGTTGASTVVSSGTVSADTSGFVIIQAAEANMTVSEVTITGISDGVAFDSTLLGL